MKLESWAIGLGTWDGGDPEFYYNTVRDTWVRGFQGGCMFHSEEEANTKNKELNAYGTEVVKGLVG